MRPSRKTIAVGIGFAALLLPLTLLIGEHVTVKLMGRQDPQAPVDPALLQREVGRFMANPKVAAARADTPPRPPWQKMGRRAAAAPAFPGGAPPLVSIGTWLKGHPDLARLWARFEDESGDPLGDAGYQDVVDRAQKLVDQDADNMRAWFLLAMGLKELQKEPTARQVLEAVLAREPGLWKGHLELGILLSDMGRFDGALAALDRAGALKANYEVYLNRGIALCFAGRFDEAEWDLWKAVEAEPMDGNAYFDIAWVHAQRGEAAGAVRLLRFAARDPSLFQKRLSARTLDGDTFFRPIWEAPEFKAYLEVIPAHDLRVERHWPTLSRTTVRRTLLERLLGVNRIADEPR